MKRSHKPSGKHTQVIRVWTLVQAQKALPLIASIVQSLREERLEAQALQLRADRLAMRAGRPGRDAIIAHKEAIRDVNQAEERFADSLQELLGLNILCLDPVAGLALIPFANGDRLAWFIFDLFEPNTLEAWRFHDDPFATRRPMAELQEKATKGSLIV